MDRLRILHLVAYPLASGPLAATLALARAQLRAGHRVWLAADQRPAPPDPYEEDAGPALVLLNAAPPAHLELSTHSGPWAVTRDLLALRRLAGDLDVVHVHTSHDHTLCAVAGLRGRVRVVRTLHAARSLLARPGQRWLLRRAHALIVRNHEHARRLLELLGADAPAHVIAGGIDPAPFTKATPAQRAEARRRFDLPPVAPVVAHVALIAGRGQAELCAALAAADPRVHALFVGRGEAEAALRRQVGELGLAERVRFAGYLPGPELPAAYHAADAAFLARPGNDAVGRAALEAMAAGVPVIAPAQDGLEELITPDAGYPIAAASPEAIAEGLRAWLSDDGAHEARAVAARQRILTTRHVDREAEATVGLYRA